VATTKEEAYEDYAMPAGCLAIRIYAAKPANPFPIYSSIEGTFKEYRGNSGCPLIDFRISIPL